MRKIDKIIVHCTATKVGQRVTVADIDRWHKQRGFRCIGYHFVVMPDGTVFTGRPVEDVGAHCKGQNQNSIGVCYVGGLDTKGEPSDTRTHQQRTALRNFLVELKRQFPDVAIHGHRDFANKACPCFDATAEYSDI